MIPGRAVGEYLGTPLAAIYLKKEGWQRLSSLCNRCGSRVRGALYSGGVFEVITSLLPGDEKGGVKDVNGAMAWAMSRSRTAECGSISQDGHMQFPALRRRSNWGYGQRKTAYVGARVEGCRWILVTFRSPRLSQG